MKISEAINAAGVQKDTARMRYNAAGMRDTFGPFSVSTDLPDEMLLRFLPELAPGEGSAAKIENRERKRNATQKGATRKNAPEDTHETAKESETPAKESIITAKNAFRALMALVVVSHCGVVIVEAFSLWHFAGLFAAVGFFAVQVGALTVSLDSSRQITSLYSVLFCGALDVMAGFLHFVYFSLERPDMPQINAGIACVLCSISFSAAGLFRHVNTD